LKHFVNACLLPPLVDGAVLAIHEKIKKYRTVTIKNISGETIELSRRQE